MYWQDQKNESCDPIFKLELLSRQLDFIES